MGCVVSRVVSRLYRGIVLAILAVWCRVSPSWHCTSYLNLSSMKPNTLPMVYS
jgi:hypothetical protein